MSLQIPKFTTTVSINKITGLCKATLRVTDIFCYCKPLSPAHTTCTFTAVAETGEAAVKSVYRMCTDTLRDRFTSELCTESLQDLQIHNEELHDAPKLQS